MSRKTKRTRARDNKFFETLENGGLIMTVSNAAKIAGYSRSSFMTTKTQIQYLLSVLTKSWKNVMTS